ncbi:FecR family protein [Chitinophaga alhagiae]|uniref:FecR family protein n=1 Tax=Chitinophaga alhagiae TaxID=2203219 RepID=UPI000E5A83BE|nr:FecR domain-containing protein [Chitinophaga alhagiae]
MQTDKERYLWLLSRLLSGDISGEEQRELEALTHADPQRRKESEWLQAYWKNNEEKGDEDSTRAAFARLTTQMNAADPALWPASDVKATAVIPENAGEAAEQYLAEEQAPPVKWYMLLARMAAAIFFLVGTWYLLDSTGLLPGREDGLRAEYNIRGTRSHIKLADGTSVWLNADSELKYPLRFKGGTREVYLKGEAFFEVTPDAAKPFIVHTETMHINVLGTSFNVKAYPGDKVTEATLISGAVEVQLKNQADKKIRLKPAEKLVVTNGKDSMQDQPQPGVPVISTATYFPKEDSAIIETAWIDNKLIFHDESFTSLATRMERWYNVSIRFENTTIQQLRFTGMFRNETVTQALEALQLTEQFNYRRGEDAIIIY